MKTLNKSQKDFLSVVSSALFGSPLPVTEDFDWNTIKNEAVSQAVLPLVFSTVSEFLPEGMRKIYSSCNRAITVKNARLSYENGEIHRIMSENCIPYVIFKGAASASYYENPSLRTSGDTDFLIAEKDFERADKALTANGYIKSGEDKGYHTAYKSPAGFTAEMHRRINGIPVSSAGDYCIEFLADTIETAKYLSDGENTVKVPDCFHHGLILLIHTASHLTASGIGLRHLCDWLVFESKLSDCEFRDIFEDKLKKCGLWRFAQLLTLSGIKYLGAPEKEWAGNADDALLEDIIKDILCGGNFGQKDEDRLRQIKYIADRKNRRIDEKGVIRQGLTAVNQKAKLSNKSRIRILSDYALMLLQRERKIDTGATLRKAAERKEIYKHFELFES